MASESVTDCFPIECIAIMRDRVPGQHCTSNNDEISAITILREFAEV